MKTARAFAKIISVALIICLALAFASCKGSLKLESFTVDRSSVKTVYFVGEAIDFSGIKATIKYSDESLNKVLGYSDLEITYASDITATTGTKSVTVSYNDPNLEEKQTTQVQITVNEDPNAVKHYGYIVDASGMKTEYLVGETLDFTGVKIYETFTNGGENVEMTDLTKAEFIYDENITAQYGYPSISVKYNGEDAGTIEIKVVDPEVDINEIVSKTVTGTYKNSYEVGDTVDFTGLTVTLVYEEGEEVVITLADITVPAVDTSSTGKKTVTISFTDPINNITVNASFEITVIEAKLEVVQFEKNESLTAFDSDNKTTGKHNYGEAGFAGEFLVGGKLYVIGDDNAFKFTPDFTVIDANGAFSYLTNYYKDVNIYVHNGENYVLLEKTATSATVYNYTLNGDNIVTVDTYKGEYSFAKPIDKVKISVMPSADHYKGLEDINPVVLEAKVIDAYNVYEAWQLAVVENNSTRTVWDDFKNEHGLAGVNVAGIVLHNDIHISANDVPASFFNASTKDVTYTNVVSGETRVAPAGTKYLVDRTMVYERLGSEEFVIEGNFFTIDTKNFPIVASVGVFDNSLDLDYGADYSNAALMRFITNGTDWAAQPEDVANVQLNNVALIGNAARDNWVLIDGDESYLASAGGLILVKSANHTVTTFDNVINNSFFISYFPEVTGHIVVKNSKCYDSYQNSAFVWGECTLTIDNSYLNGSGGPIIISMSVLDGNEVYRNPVVTVTGSTIDTSLTGEEIWFKSVGATTLIGSIKAVGDGVNTMLAQVGAAGNIVDGDGKMNIKGALMREGNDISALNDAMIQGAIYTDGTGIDRWYTAQPWGTIINHPAFAQAAPFLTVYDQAGTAHTIFYNGVTFCDLMNNPIGTQAAHADLIAAFAAADEIVLQQGGLSVLFELYH